MTVEAIGAGGDGLATHGGERLYVPFAAPGDVLRVRPRQRRAGGQEAEILAVLEPGPDRVEPPCPRFGLCGGCALQHLSAQSLADVQMRWIADALRRAGLAHAPIEPVVRVPESDRRRARLAARKLSAEVIIGFNARYSHRIVDIAPCRILAPELHAILAPLAGCLSQVLDRAASVDVELTLLDDGIDIVLVGLPDPSLDACMALSGFAETQDLARLSVRHGQGTPVEPLAHRREGIVRLGGLAVTIPPGGFLQASRTGEHLLQSLVRSALGGLAGPGARLVDLFAGCGTFAIDLLAAGAQVHAVEGDAGSTAALSAVARRVTGLSVERRDLTRDPVPAALLAGFDAVVFDPPRVGAAAQSSQIAASRVPLVVAVSCNPATFARDARILVDGGYELERVWPVDQFRWSAHIELVALFRRPA